VLPRSNGQKKGQLAGLNFMMVVVMVVLLLWRRRLLRSQCMVHAGDAGLLLSFTPFLQDLDEV
jgi:hypothetical protein